VHLTKDLLAESETSFVRTGSGVVGRPTPIPQYEGIASINQ